MYVRMYGHVHVIVFDSVRSRTTSAEYSFTFLDEPNVPLLAGGWHLNRHNLITAD